MNKENSSRSANSIRSPYKTRSYISKTGNKLIDIKTAEKTLTQKKTKKTAIKEKSKPTVEKVVAKPKTSDNKVTTKKSNDQQQNKKKGFNISSLSEDTLCAIFEYVGVCDTLINVRRVCKSWNAIVQKVKR